MSQLGRTSKKILFVVDERTSLRGTLTDGDIRRGLLRGVGLEDSVSKVLFVDYLAAKSGDERRKFDRLMELHQLDGVPVLDEQDRVVDVWLRSEAPSSNPELQPQTRVLIMAGGRGERLMPLTKDTPKPMLHVNGATPLDTLLRRLAHQGFVDIAIAIHHQGTLIRNHVGDGESLGLQITYIEESRPLGTAGALGLLMNQEKCPTLVVNADIITDARLDGFVRSANSPTPLTTVGLARHLIHVPYGVAITDGPTLVDVKEKPVFERLVLAGVTFVTPETQQLVEAGETLNMTDLLTRARAAGQEVRWRDLDAFWVDIGSHEEINTLRRRPV